MRYALLALALLSTSCLQEDGDEDPEPHPIVGFWFLCENDMPAPSVETCAIVDDDGLYFSASDSVMRIDGAMVYAKAKMGDTTAGSAFDIRVPELVFFAEREARYGAYTVVGDTVHIDASEPGSGEVVRESIRIELADGFLILYDGNQAVKGYRKYAGKASLVTKAEWESAVE